MTEMQHAQQDKEIRNLPEEAGNRDRTIVRTSLLGIGANVLLAAVKAVVGFFTGSIAISLDAVNNLSDAGSGIITIAGTRLAAKRPDRQHPYGHGRLEYLSAMALGAIIMSAGLTSFQESVRKILHPVRPGYTAISLAIVALCILVKVFLGRYTIGTGRSAGSEPLVNAGKDALMDAFLSASTLAAALIFLLTDISSEAWIGCLISVFIIRAGFEMIMNTVSELLGKRVDAGLVHRVQKTVEEFPEVYGVYDLNFHDYGPGRVAGSLQVEVEDTMPAWKVSDLIRRIKKTVYEKHRVLLTAVGIYAMNTGDEKAAVLRRQVTDIAMEYEHVLQVHGFYLKDNMIQFDILIDFDEKDPAALCDAIRDKIRALHPELEVRMFWDADYNFSE